MFVGLNHKDTQKNRLAITCLLQSAPNPKSNVPPAGAGRTGEDGLRQNYTLIRHTGGFILLLEPFAQVFDTSRRTFADWFGLQPQPFLFSTAN